MKKSDLSPKQWKFHACLSFEVVARCDDCDEAATPNKTRVEATVQLENDGWSVDWSRVALLCPSCTIKNRSTDVT